MKIAVEGCAHGELDIIYDTIACLERENNIKVDLLIICGDFQSVRNPTDLDCMAVPPKYRKLNTFYKYYSGEKTAPVLTIFIGGNHEASNYLAELPYGGWVCPNIYYLGYANVVNIGGVRIAGLSGIFKGNDYLRGHFECPPYNQSTKRSVYHVRNIDVFRLKQIQTSIDICVSHDWPKSVYNYGNKNELLRRKPFFKDEVDRNSLGSQPAEELLHKLKPSYWFAAHLHCKFAALIPHNNDSQTYTKFLALDKCLPHRKFLQIVDIGETISPVHLEYDPEWLCVLRSTDHLLSTSSGITHMPGMGGLDKYDFTPTHDELEDIHKLYNNDFKVPNNFVVTASTYSSESKDKIILKAYINPQTTLFCNILEIKDPFAAITSGFKKNDFVSADTDATISTFVTSTQSGESSLSDNDADDDNLSSRDEKTDDADVMDNELFFIDKVGTLEAPYNEPSNLKQYLLSQHGSTSVCEKEAFISELNFPSIKESDGKSTNALDDIPVKKLKRRNMSLYKTDDET